MVEKIQPQNIEGHEYLRPKPYLAIIFWAIFLLMRFEDFILMFYIWVPNITIKGA